MNIRLKWFVKLLLFLISSILVSPLIACLLLARIFDKDKSYFQGASQLLSIIPFRIGMYVRAAFYKHSCHNVHREVNIGFMTLLSQMDVDIEQHTYIGPQCNIGSCIIGKDCLLGSGVHVLSGKNQHSFSDMTTPIRNQGGTLQKIEIGENCWIGNNATIMANIGDNSIVAAGSVVVNAIPADSIAAGNPAHVIKNR